MSSPYPELEPEDYEGSPDAPNPISPEFLSSITEDDILQAGIEYAQAALPEWEPRAGNTEVVLMEALAQMLSVLGFAIQEVPSQLLDQLMRLYGVSRNPGRSATAIAEFQVSGSQPVYTVPADTLLRATISGTEETADFYTRGSLDIVTGDGGKPRQWIVAAEPGTHTNRLPAGTRLDVVDGLPFVESVRLHTETSRGQDVETDAAFETRSAALLGRLVSTLVVPAHFQLAALEIENVGRARVLDLYDPDKPDAEKSVGHVTVVVADAAGEKLPQAEKDQAQLDLSAQALASLIIHVEDPTYTEVNLNVTIMVGEGEDPEVVSRRVQQRLRAWLHPSRWPWRSEVRQFEVVSLVGAVDGVNAVRDASADIAVPGLAPLTRPGRINVSIYQGD